MTGPNMTDAAEPGTDDAGVPCRSLRIRILIVLGVIVAGVLAAALGFVVMRPSVDLDWVTADGSVAGSVHYSGTEATGYRTRYVFTDEHGAGHMFEGSALTEKPAVAGTDVTVAFDPDNPDDAAIVRTKPLWAAYGAIAALILIAAGITFRLGLLIARPGRRKPSGV